MLQKGDCGRWQDSTEKMKACSNSLIIEITYLCIYELSIYGLLINSLYHHYVRWGRRECLGSDSSFHY